MMDFGCFCWSRHLRFSGFGGLANTEHLMPAATQAARWLPGLPNNPEKQPRLGSTKSNAHWIGSQTTLPVLDCQEAAGPGHR